jgi:hypothetical protein
MKKNLIGFAAIVIAIGSLAFTNASKKNIIECATDSNLVWYVVESGDGANNIDINDPIAINRLDLTAYSNLGIENPAVVNSTDFPTSNPNKRIFTKSEALTQFGCAEENTYLCAVAFEVPGTPSDHFELNGSNKVVPRNSEGLTVPLVKCIIYRSTP